MTGEFEAIERFRQLLPGPPAGETWIGDDAALVVAPRGGLLLAADLVVAGVHVDLDLVGLDDMGWKAMAVNVSDIAAMGGEPTHALVAVAAPPETDLHVVFRGIADAVEAYGCPVVGGDLSSGSQLVISVTIVGDAGNRPPVLRAGALPGDTIFVTGPVGGSAAGLRVLREGREDEAKELADAYRRPQARVSEGRAARRAGATAMVDVSDGLAADLRHLADQSGVGVVIDNVPVRDGATMDEALGGGEDYELVFTATNAGHVVAAFAETGLRQPIAIGRCTSDPNERRLGEGELPVAGWQHHWA
ncbi:MAG TPA: thiamine-phosphate kinase [Acidimicrobiales bacterium]|nr:thiamine-phosphate kinase [Acidimicrobiales bacterium]